MKKEYKYWFVGNHRNFNDAENVVIGSEICPIQILSSKNKNLLNESIVLNRAIRFVTPIVPNKYVELIYSMIKSLPYGCKVTFNDWGLLHKSKDLIISQRIIPVLGRIITHSLIDCPWHDDIIKNEVAFIEIFKQSNMKFDSKIEFMKLWGIKEIEINNCPKTSLDYFHKNNILVTQYSDYNILSVSRTCFHMKLLKMNTEVCLDNNNCPSKLYNVKMTDYYSNRHKLLVHNNISIINWDDTMVFGNALFIKNYKICDDIDFLIEEGE